LSGNGDAGRGATLIARECRCFAVSRRIEPAARFRVQKIRLMYLLEITHRSRSIIQSINIKPVVRFILEQKNNLDVADVVTDKISFVSP
jgi:hypothetical protein